MHDKQCAKHKQTTDLKGVGVEESPRDALPTRGSEPQGTTSLTVAS